MWGAAGLVAGLVGTARSLGFIWNTTSSVPVGLWRVSRGDVTRGSVVALCPPDGPKTRAARSAGIVPPGACPGGYMRLLKPVAGLPGDEVVVDRQGVRVNGWRLQNSAARDSQLAPEAVVPVDPGLYRVRSGEYWLVSNYNPGSWDSRYFGPVREVDVEGVARQVADYDRLKKWLSGLPDLLPAFSGIGIRQPLGREGS